MNARVFTKLFTYVIYVFFIVCYGTSLAANEKASSANDTMILSSMDSGKSDINIPNITLDSILGINTIGTTVYPFGGMRRVSKLTLSSGSYSGLYWAVIDPVNGYAYFSTANSINPGWLIKVDISGPVPVEVGAASAAVGEYNLIGGAIDVSAGVAFFGCTSSPGRVLKFSLGAGSAPPTYIGSIALNSGENGSWGIGIDTRDADPTKHYLYIATQNSPGLVVKVAPGATGQLPSRVSSLTLNSGENFPRRVVMDEVNGYLYLSAFGSFPLIIKVAMTPDNNPPQRIGTAVLDSVTAYHIGSEVIDVADGAAYLGTYDTNSSLLPARVFKALLGTENNPPQAAGSVLLNPGPPAERELCSAVIDPAGGYAYFGTDHTFAAKIFKIRLGTSGTAPVETALLQLQSGTQPNPPDGTNMINNPETLYGEVYMQSAVFDPVRGYAYFGTDSNHGQVVKVAVSHKGAMKATRAVLTETAEINGVNFYTHTAGGNVRLAFYDNQAPKNLLWQSSIIPLSAPGWQHVNITSGTLVLNPGTYWLTWQTDSTADVPSYQMGSAGDGFFVEMPFGVFPASLAAVQSSSETWSMYATYCSPLTGPGNTLLLNKSGSTINLQWTAGNGADGYHVLRCLAGVGCTFTTIASPIITQYNDPVLADLFSYWYAVESFNSCTTAP